MPVYLSVLMTTLVALPAAATMFLASYVLTIYVDFYRVQGGDRVPTDPRGKLWDKMNDSLHDFVFSRVYVTLQPALSVGRSVGRSVGWSVTLYFFL